MAVSVLTPFPVITDIDGQPLDDGYIWIGVDGLEPVANPQTVYWDAALTDPATQPVRTRGGYALDGSTRSRLFTLNPYSIRVDNQNGSTVYQSLSENGRFGGNVTASDVVTAAGVTVQDGIWDQGNQTATTGVVMRIDKIIEDTTVETLQSLGGIWPGGPVYTYAAASKEFTNSPVAGGTAPFVGLFMHAVNNNSGADVCAFLSVATAWTNGDTAFGGNIIARTAAGITAPKLVGLEIDVQPATGVVPSSDSGGLFINAFEEDVPGPAILLGGIAGGTFNNGLVIGGLSSSAAGVAGEASATMGSLINTGVATYTQDAIIVTNGQKIRFGGTAGTHAKIYNDGSNNVRAVLGSGVWIWRNSADTTSLVSIDGGGNVNLEAGGVLRISSTQVVGPRGAAVAAPAGGATVDAEARTAISTIISRLQAHGLIA